MPTAPVQPVETINKHLPPKLAEAVAKITDINSLPEITTKIVQVVEDPRATAREMHDIVRTDPALTAKILKVVNSAFYGLPSQIASLDRAILLLGLSAVKNIALAASLARLFKADAISEQFAARDLWRHCIAVAVAAREIAGRCNRQREADELFVAGLVHDMGLIVVQQLFPAQLRGVAETCLDQGANFCQEELRRIGADHEAFGLALGTRWKFPPMLRSVIAHHHNPADGPAEFEVYASVVNIADTLACQGRFGFYLTAQSQVLGPELLSKVGVTQEQLDAVMADLPARVEDAERVFAE